MTPVSNEEYNCRQCGTPVYRNAPGQTRDKDTGRHHDCAQVLLTQRDEARHAHEALREKLGGALREVTPHLPGGTSGNAMWQFAEAVRAALDASK